MTKFNPNTAKQTIKRPIKRLIQAFAANFGRHTRKPKQPELLILMYHRILPTDDPRALLEEPGMMVSPETFRLHMSIIKSLFETMHLSRWLELKNSGSKLPLRTCAITFDDGWADNYEFAYPILQELDMPATIFLVSDMIGTDKMFWPERLARTLNTIAQECPDQWSNSSLDWIKQGQTSYQFSTLPPTQEELSEIIANAKIYTDKEINARLDYIESELQLLETRHTPSLLNWGQVSEMTKSGLIELGSHSCQHIRLNDDISSELLQHEVVASKRNIEQHTKHTISLFCFPNGDYSSQAMELVRENYIGAITTKSGWNTIISDDHTLQRIGVHEDITKDRTGFLARISNLF